MTNKNSNHNNQISSSSNRSESANMTSANHSRADTRDRYRLQYPFDRYDYRNYRSSSSDTTFRQYGNKLEDQKNISYRERIRLVQRKINDLRNTIKDSKDHSVITATRDHIAVLNKLIDSLEVGMKEEEENARRRERRDGSHSVKQADKPTKKDAQVTSERSNPVMSNTTISSSSTDDPRPPSTTSDINVKIEDKWPTVKDFISSFEDNLMHQMTSFSQSLSPKSSDETKKDHKECLVEKHEQPKPELTTAIPTSDPSSSAPIDHPVNLLVPEETTEKAYVSSDKLLQVYNCRQNLGETLPNYINRFTQLCRKARVEDSRFLAMVFHRSLVKSVMAIVQERVLAAYSTLGIQPNDYIQQEETYSTYVAKLRFLLPSMHQDINRVVQLEKAVASRSKKRKANHESNDTRAEKKKRLSPARETSPNTAQRPKNPCRFCKIAEYTKQHKCAEFYKARALKQLKAQKEAQREEEHDYTNNGSYQNQNEL